MLKIMILLISVGSFAIMAGCSLHSHNPEHEAVSVERSETIKVDYPVKEGMKLFTAEGEKVWVPGWDCQVLKGDGFNKGDIFICPKHHNLTFILLEYDEVKGKIMYSKVTPGISAGSIEINLKPLGNGSTVNITYRLTSLSSKGAKIVSELSDENFSQEMGHWETNIRNHEKDIDRWLKTKK